MQTILNSSKRRCKLYYDLMAVAIRAQSHATTPLDFFNYIRTEAYNAAITEVMHKIERSEDKNTLIIDVSGMKKPLGDLLVDDDSSPFIKNTRVYSSIRRMLYAEKKWKE